MKILIAEDDPVSRRVLTATLTKWEYEVVECCDGTAALHALQAPDAPRLAILDWMMPGMDGVEICRKLRESLATESTYVILLTAKTEKDDIVAGLKAGADDYVTKPFYRNELRARLQVGARVVTLQQRLAERAGENARLEMLTQASRALAHHIRNALTPMVGMAQLKTTNNPQYSTRLRQIVLRNGQYIAAIIDALIEMAQTGVVPTVNYSGMEQKEMLDMDALIQRFLEERLGRYEA